MKTIAIIGGGIVGTTAAFYLSKAGHCVHVYDDNTGQATQAAAGIICPWLSQRRNKIWYTLASNGAIFYETLLTDLTSEGLATDFYRQTGAVVIKNTPSALEKLVSIVTERKEMVPQIGNMRVLSQTDWETLYPEFTPQSQALFVSGGAVLDGKSCVNTLKQACAHYRFKWINQRITDLKKIQQDYDTVILATGAWLPELLKPFGLNVDVRGQKGQLLTVTLSHKNTAHYPVFMPTGEFDLLPFENGKWVIGATHENEAGYDLTPTPELLEQMKTTASHFLPELAHVPIDTIRVGTRAYTSDFTPFFGKVSQLENVYVASGLGSSGLTSGAYIGYLLALMVNQHTLPLDTSVYTPDHYIT